MAKNIKLQQTNTKLILVHLGLPLICVLSYIFFPISKEISYTSYISTFLLAIISTIRELIGLNRIKKDFYSAYLIGIFGTIFCFVIIFSMINLTISTFYPGSFSIGQLNKTNALYLSITTLTTIGCNIYPLIDIAKYILMFETLFYFILTVVVIVTALDKKRIAKTNEKYEIIDKIFFVIIIILLIFFFFNKMTLG